MQGFARELTHPVPLGAVLVLAVNDHWLKGSGLLSEVVTGKLSDFAGLFFFPLLLLALIRVVLGEPRSKVPAAGAIVLTAVVFAALKTAPPFAALISDAWGPIVCDPTDLVATPMLLVSWWWIARFTA